MGYADIIQFTSPTALWMARLVTRVYYAQILYYYFIPEFFHAIHMQACSNYAHFIIEKTPQT